MWWDGFADVLSISIDGHIGDPPVNDSSGGVLIYLRGLCYVFWYGRGGAGGEDNANNTSYYLRINKWYYTLSPINMDSGAVMLYITAYGGFHTVVVNDNGTFENRGGGVL